MKQKKKEIFEIVRESPSAGIKLLYENYGKNLYSYGIKTWKLSEDECWEIVYKTIYKSAEKTSAYKFNSEPNYRSFIFTVFINFIKNYYKKRQIQKEQLLQVDFEEIKVPIAAEEKYGSEEESQEHESAPMAFLKEELDKLEDWERILLLMRCQEIPYSEISKFVNKPAEQLKVYYQRLKNSMLKKLEQNQAFKKEDTDERK